METGWIVSIVLGVVILVLILVIVIWVVMRRQAQTEDSMSPVTENETADEHNSHSLSKHVNDRWDRLLKSWESEQDKSGDKK